GRTGVVSGKTFSGKDWSLTARAGLHYEFDLTDSADVHLKDAAGEHQINGRKDGRMLYGVGLNARFGDNTRLGLEVERSAFAYSALFDHGLASKSDQRFASIRSTGNLTFSTAF
ncbi:autotransporter outer membrane beta-barrel domain-containing protein, partial [Escherichia coli]|uniref:autotransporter outer membrane beta-barrel domain-containing protein n=1 Tax=Escherichia coli TaxID=562 RepID=UPI00203258C2